MNYSDYDFKFAKLILQEMRMQSEIRDVLKTVNMSLGRNVKPTPSQILQRAFIEKGWSSEYKVSEKASHLRFDLYKNKVAIEIQLTDPSDCYNDYMKFLLAYNVEKIEVGVEIVYDRTVVGNNLPKLEKVKSDLQIYRRVLSCPIWVIGLKE
jgi:histone acetyltransferase (RNA polymerase elongator complex component)